MNVRKWDHWVAVKMLPIITRVSTCDFYSVMLSELQKSALRDLGSSSKDYYVLAAQKVSENHFHWLQLLKKVIRASPSSRIRESDSTSQHKALSSSFIYCNTLYNIVCLY